MKGRAKKKKKKKRKITRERVSGKNWGKNTTRGKNKEMGGVSSCVQKGKPEGLVKAWGRNGRPAGLNSEQTITWKRVTTEKNPCKGGKWNYSKKKLWIVSNKETGWTLGGTK